MRPRTIIIPAALAAVLTLSTTGYAISAATTQGATPCSSTCRPTSA